MRTLERSRQGLNSGSMTYRMFVLGQVVVPPDPVCLSLCPLFPGGPRMTLRRKDESLGSGEGLVIGECQG